MNSQTQQFTQQQQLLSPYEQQPQQYQSTLYDHSQAIIQQQQQQIHILQSQINQLANTQTPQVLNNTTVPASAQLSLQDRSLLENSDGSKRRRLSNEPTNQSLGAISCNNSTVLITDSIQSPLTQNPNASNADQISTSQSKILFSTYND